jgi:hypothetical protein
MQKKKKLLVSAKKAQTTQKLKQNAYRQAFCSLAISDFCFLLLFCLSYLKHQRIKFKQMFQYLC